MTTETLIAITFGALVGALIGPLVYWKFFAARNTEKWEKEWEEERQRIIAEREENYKGP